MRHPVSVALHVTLGSLLLMAGPRAAEVQPISLLTAPVSVTGRLERGDSGYIAQISVHSGPLAHVISTDLPNSTSTTTAEQMLKQFVRYRNPYVLVRELCARTAWQCESVAVFKPNGNVVVRLGDVIGTLDNAVRDGHVYDVYNKLEQKVDGLSHASSPKFTLALDDNGTSLAINAQQTWTINQTTWLHNAEMLASLKPQKSWSQAEWENYLSALITNAALARYCQRQEELQALLSTTEPNLDMLHRRALTDALSMVTPLELPRAWRQIK